MTFSNSPDVERGVRVAAAAAATVETKEVSTMKGDPKKPVPIRNKLYCLLGAFFVAVVIVLSVALTHTNARGEDSAPMTYVDTTNGNNNLEQADGTKNESPTSKGDVGGVTQIEAKKTTTETETTETETTETETTETETTEKVTPETETTESEGTESEGTETETTESEGTESETIESEGTESETTESEGTETETTEAEGTEAEEWTDTSPGATDEGTNGDKNDEGGTNGQAPWSRFDKSEWPELLGMDVAEAKTSIEEETKGAVEVIPLGEDDFHISDYRLDRVWLFHDTDNKVSKTPRLG